MNDKIKLLFGFEDEILVDYVMSSLETYKTKYPDPKLLHINLVGFLNENTTGFMEELLGLLLEMCKGNEKTVR